MLDWLKKKLPNSASEYAEEERLLARFLQTEFQTYRAGWWKYSVRGSQNAAQYLLKGRAAARLIMAIVEKVQHAKPDPRNVERQEGLLVAWAQELLNNKPEFEDSEIFRIVRLSEPKPNSRIMIGGGTLARIALAHANRVGATGVARDALKAAIETCERNQRPYAYGDADEKRQVALMKHLLDGGKKDLPPMNDAWQAPFNDPIFEALNAYAWTAKSPRPSPKWLKKGNEILASFDKTRFVDAFEASTAAMKSQDQPVDALVSDHIRGICWLVGMVDDPRVPFLLGRMMQACGYKLSGIGARSQKGFSACVQALEALGSMEGLAELSKAKAQIKTPSLASTLEGTLNAAAAERNIPVEELEELVVPTFDLDQNGQRRFEFGDLTAILAIAPTGVEVTWQRNGKELKSKPTIQPEFKAEATAITKLKKEIETALSAQKNRLESLYLVDRSWPYETWRERYADHPLMGGLSGRLVWRFTGPGFDTLGMPRDGQVLDLEDRPLAVNGDYQVQLWHPLDMGISAVEAWREHLIANEIVQPFKQAHREVYILTAAEETTETYSNRFAAHVLRQHQCAALMRARGWRYQLQGYFDFQSTPTRVVTPDLKVEYFVDVPATEAAAEHMSESGVALYVLTDQVRFVDRFGAAISLADIPPKLFSELMRDVDLFVGVASVGNDPLWRDQGERMGFGNYWHSFAFGDLSATAETRRAILERLLPRLAIGSVAKLEGKFLVVTGSLRSYKIHLGSGNILMTPNDQYLCIVPGRTPAKNEHIYLPFDGDSILAVILSKAIMLADDKKITDPTITRQIKIK